MSFQCFKGTYLNDTDITEIPRPEDSKSYPISFIISYSKSYHGLTSGVQGSMNVHRGALLLVPQ